MDIYIICLNKILTNIDIYAIIVSKFKVDKGYIMIQILDSMKNNKSYDGNTPKFGITLNGVNYIVKAPKDGSDSVFTEYVASRFIKDIGVPVHDVYLGSYTGSVANMGYNGLVDIIKDFSTTNLSLHSFKDLNQSSVDTDLGDKEYSYDDVTNVINNILRVDPETKSLLLHRFWQMYICDAILGNRDRHWGNWGFLRNSITKQIYPAPLYDNGGCLFPNVSQRIDELFTNTKQFLYDRTVVFPASLLKKYDKTSGRFKRTNYKDILSDTRFSKTFAYERKQFVEKGLDGVCTAITNATTHKSLPQQLVIFYRLIVTLRYLCIVKRMNFDTAYNQTMSIWRGTQ